MRLTHSLNLALCRPMALGLLLSGCDHDEQGSIKLTRDHYTVEAGRAVPITVAVSGRLKSATWRVVDAAGCKGEVKKLGAASAEFSAPAHCTSDAQNTVELQAQFEEGAPVTLAATINIRPAMVVATRDAAITVATETPPRLGATLDLVSIFKREDVRDFPAKGFKAEHTIKTDSVEIYLNNTDDTGWGVVCVENLEGSSDLTRFKTISVDLDTGLRPARGSGQLEIKVERPDSSGDGSKIVGHVPLPIPKRTTHTLNLQLVDAPVLLDTRRICLSSVDSKLKGDAAVRLYGITFQ